MSSKKTRKMNIYCRKSSARLMNNHGLTHISHPQNVCCIQPQEGSKNHLPVCRLGVICDHPLTFPVMFSCLVISFFHCLYFLYSSAFAQNPLNVTRP